MSAFAALANAWALLVGLALIMIGNGLQGTLLGLRASLEGFDTLVTGFVMTSYFAGFFIGSLFAPRLVESVGHMRVFAALASLASAAVLLHGIFPFPLLWAVMRLITGFCYAGMYVVVESWLNEASSRETRGKVLSGYMLVVLGGAALGQMLLNLGDPSSIELFILISVLVSLAVVPPALSAARAPSIDAPERMSIRTLFRASPLGTWGTLLVGMSHATSFGLGAVYANSIGFDTKFVSYFMGSFLLGAIILQWPIGWVSDRTDRRKVITVLSTVSCLAALAAMLATDISDSLLLLCMVLLGGSSLPLYSLCIAHTNDHLEPRQILRASSALMMIGGIGLTLGPMVTALVMSELGVRGYFLSLSAIHASLVLYATYRMTRRAAPAVEEQHAYQPLLSRASPVLAAMAYRALRDERDRLRARLLRRKKIGTPPP